MNKIVKYLACAAILLAGTSLNAQEEDISAQEQLKQMEAMKRLLAGAMAASPEEQAILDSFFTLYNDEDFETLYAQQFSAQIQTIKSPEKFQETVSAAKNKTGSFLSAQATGSAAGKQVIMSTDTGQFLDEALKLSTQTRKWTANFENGTYYLSFDFYKEGQELKLYRVKLADSKFSPTFRVTM